MFDRKPLTLLPYYDCESKLKEHMLNKRPPCHLLDLYRMAMRDLLTISTAESTAASIEINGCGDW